jgi:hypothetical protein
MVRLSYLSPLGSSTDVGTEPSSALADRIIRALDNPSPPPKFEALPYVTDLPKRGFNTPLPLVDISSSPTPQPHLTPLPSVITNPGKGDRVDGNPEIIAATAMPGSALRRGSLLLDSSSSPSAPVACYSPQFDLISFDSFEASPQPRFFKADVREAGPSTPKSFKDISTNVTDFLTSSPTPPPFAPQATVTDHGGTVANLESMLRIATPPKQRSVTPDSGMENSQNDMARVSVLSESFADKWSLKQRKEETSGSVRDPAPTSKLIFESERFEGDSEDVQKRPIPILRRSPRRSVSPQVTVTLGSSIRPTGKSQTTREGALPTLVEKDEFHGVSGRDLNSQPSTEEFKDVSVKPEESGKGENNRHDEIEQEEAGKVSFISSNWVVFSI